MTGLSDAVLKDFTTLFCATEKVVTVFSQGVNQSATGTDKVNAILNCHLEIDNPLHRVAVKEFWQGERIARRPGFKAVEMFRAVGDGRIKAIWIIHTNPVVSMPDADAVAAALRACPFVVVSDITAETDTARLADVLLPASGWGEKSGTVTNSDRSISRQRVNLPAPGLARADWAILAEVGVKMGWSESFDWRNEAEIFREHAALSGVAGRLGSDFDISDHAEISDTDYANLAPFTWPANSRQHGGRFSGDGQFHTADGRARMLAITPQPPQMLTADLPFRLNTGRNRDQWHTMTRTAKSPRLSQHLAEPFLEVHPADSAAKGLRAADLVEVSNTHGSALLRVLITDRVARGEVFAPMHWTGENASRARIDVLVPGVVDPISGQPDSKAAPVKISHYKADWYGFAVASAAVHPTSEYWARARVAGGWRVELAGKNLPEDWVAYARALFDLPEATVATVIDAKRRLARVAFHAEGQLLAALFIGPDPVALARDHVAARLLAPDAAAALAGRPGADAPDPGPTVCACLNVGVNTLRAAIASGRARSVAALGEALGAGTSCGSCRPELSGLLAKFHLPEAAL